MGKLLVTVLTYILTSSLSKILVGAGLGLGSGIAIKTLLQSYIDSSIGSISALGDVASYAHLAGIDTSLSIIFGAMVTRITFDSAKVFIKKVAS